MTEEIQALFKLIAEGAEFELSANDSGTEYLLRNKEDAKTAHLEGDDAEAFSQEYSTIKTQFPDYSVDQMLAQLWDQGGYSWMAVGDDDEE
ncbi:MAG: hypothetical protein CTY29_08595 [Methylobacter sp.]|nr:MAG: hypothetical protein CTY29_08595 [Methylobacter sp.]PPD23479.1 MAG: hypothetical protein CTY24_04240 [Methylobacter sp.]